MQRMPDPLENERITLRLDADELRLMDEFIVSSREFSNRSQLARTAISIYIESRAGGEEGTIRKANEVVVQLPPLVLDTIAHLVAEGMYSNISEAVADCARHQFIHEEHVESIKKDAVQQRSALKVVPKA
jgi:metal-responsive CopG/Arc/MetJ family transcriptional regulator